MSAAFFSDGGMGLPAHAEDARFAGGALADSYQYTTIDPPGSTYSVASGINDNGQTVGYYFLNNYFGHVYACLYGHGVLTAIDPPGGADAMATNAKGRILGDLTDHYIGKVFLYHEGKYTKIVPPGINNSQAAGINDRGEIVGNTQSNGFIYSHGHYSIIHVSGSLQTLATRINASGHRADHAFLFSCGTYTTIDFPGSFFTLANGINEQGQIVGQFDMTKDTPPQGFLYSGGAHTILNVPGANGTAAIGINDLGQVVDNYWDASGSHGFVYNGGGYTSFDPPNSFGTFPHGINFEGQIVGEFSDGITTRAFLASPVGSSTPSPGGPRQKIEQCHEKHVP
jgi:probable HAF family extracellular repeat protein